MTTLSNFFFALIITALRTVQHLRKEHHLEPTKFEKRDYEWQDKAYCLSCSGFKKHRYIEWIPERTVTRECLTCGEETAVL